MEIGQRLRELREQRDLTGRAAATYLGISSAHVSDMENDKARPSLDLLARLARYYRTSTDYLLGLTDDPFPPGGALPPEGELMRLMRLVQRMSDEAREALFYIAEALASKEKGPTPSELARMMREQENEQKGDAP